jgi:cysteine dioxygenase
MDAGSSASHMSSLAPSPLVARGEASRAAAPAAGRSLVELVREIKAALGSRPAPGKPSFLSSVEAAMAPPPGGGEGSVVVVGSRVEEREALLARLDQPRLLAAMASFDAEPGALRRYSHFAQSKTCARNLIAGDDTFSLLLLCWTRGKESPIHDHPSAGCFMRVVSGAVTETLFARDEARNALVELRCHTARAGDVLFVNDSLGFHKISCSGEGGAGGGTGGSGEGGAEDENGKGTVTLHLYVPPFSSCRAWSSADQSLDAPCRPRVTLHSAFGRLVSDAAPESNALSSDVGGAPGSAEACLARAEKI